MLPVAFLGTDFKTDHFWLTISSLQTGQSRLLPV
jgi:hypothetical protein